MYNPLGERPCARACAASGRLDVPGLLDLCGALSGAAAEDSNLGGELVGVLLGKVEGGQPCLARRQ